jgi:hypothetical protein
MNVVPVLRAAAFATELPALLAARPTARGKRHYRPEDLWKRLTRPS